MPIKKANVKIENGKVVFSQEILDYFESIKTEENSEWIDKYFEVLADTSNFNAEKYNIHHIRPCFTFKDENHKTRKETEPFADEFNGNLIKLSVYNHVFIHYYLWKIFNNKDSKLAFQRMCGINKYTENITENELKEIAILKEECTKENLTDEELKELRRKYNVAHKEKRKKYDDEHKKEKAEYDKEYRKKNNVRISKRRKIYREKNKDKIAESLKIWYFNHREERLEKNREYNKVYDSQQCYDPKENDNCTLSALRSRKRRHHDRYINIIPTDCIIKNDNIS